MVTVNEVKPLKSILRLRFFVAKVAINRLFGNAGLLGDLVHAGAFETLIKKQFASGFENILPFYFALASPTLYGGRGFFSH